MQKTWMKFDEFTKAHTINTFRVPQDEGFQVAYEAYKIAENIKRLPSEKGRCMFAEDFIEDDRLGTLADLCTKALGMGSRTEAELAMLCDDPAKRKSYYQNLSLDLPFEQCYHIDDEDYWRRVVYAKTKGKFGLSEVNWKNTAMSMKLKELMESYSPALWQSWPIIRVAPLIKEFIVELTVDNLRPMDDRVWKEYLETGDVDVVEGAIFDMTYIFSPRDSSSSSDSDSEMADGEYEDMGSLDGDYTSDGSVAKSHESESRSTGGSIDPEVMLAAPPKKKRRKKRVKSVFDIELSEEEDSEIDIKDRRNIKKYMAHRRLTFPAELSHHIDLRFLRYYDHLVTLRLQFQGVGSAAEAERWKYNVSDLDIERLAYSLRYMERLKEFRLTSSRLDANKMLVVVKALKHLPLLDTVDFSFDQLHDDLSGVLHQLFKTKTLRSLELRGNQFDNGNCNLQQLGKELMSFKGHLEYLDLGFNSVGDDGLSELCSALVAKEQVPHLCLSGLQISEHAFIECVAKQLVGKHMKLVKLEISALGLSANASHELLKALQLNTRLKYLDCRGCDMPPTDEYEAEVMIRRNHFLEENPQCLDETKFKVPELHPAILRSLASIERIKECQDAKPVRFVESVGSIKEVERETVTSYGDYDYDDYHIENSLADDERRLSSASEGTRYSVYSSDAVRIVSAYDDEDQDSEEEYISHFRV